MKGRHWAIVFAIACLALPAIMATIARGLRLDAAAEIERAGMTRPAALHDHVPSIVCSVMPPAKPSPLKKEGWNPV